MVVYVTFLRDVACQKLLNSANISRSYSQNNTGTVFLRHGVWLNKRWCNYWHFQSLVYVTVYLYLQTLLVFPSSA